MRYYWYICMYIYIYVYPWLSALYIYIYTYGYITIIYIYSYICCTIIWRTLALPNTSGSKSGYIYNKTTRRLVNLKKTHVLWCVLTSSQAFQSPDLSYWLSTPFSFGLKNQSLPKEPKAKKKTRYVGMVRWPKMLCSSNIRQRLAKSRCTSMMINWML